MTGIIVLGIWITGHYSNGGLNTSLLTKWWSEYWTAMVPGIWIAYHLTSEHIPMIWLPNSFTIQIPTVLRLGPSSIFLVPNNSFVRISDLNCVFQFSKPDRRLGWTQRGWSARLLTCDPNVSQIRIPSLRQQQRDDKRRCVVGTFWNDDTKWCCHHFCRRSHLGIGLVPNQ